MGVKEDMNDVQAKILEIFKEVKQLCDANDIPYYAICGTCLGAVRHNGFIPWDDDIDIGIPIEYYEKFLALCRTELPVNLQLYTYKEHPHYINIFVKIIDINTTFIEEAQYDYIDTYKGVFIDIMPLSGVPKNPKEKRDFEYKVYMFFVLNYVRRLNWKDMCTWKHKLIWLLMKLFYKWIPIDCFSDAWIELLKKYSLEKSEKIGQAWTKEIKKFIFEKELFLNVEEIPFEDTVIKCPYGWDKYLSKHFGNYMQFPPENQRFSGHSGIIDLRCSYKEYQKHPEWIYMGNNLRKEV